MAISRGEPSRRVNATCAQCRRKRSADAERYRVREVAALSTAVSFGHSSTQRAGVCREPLTLDGAHRATVGHEQRHQRPQHKTHTHHRPVLTMARIMVVTTPISTPLPAQTYAQCHLAYVDHAAAVVNLAIVMVGG